MRFCVIIPTYQGEKTLPKLFEKLMKIVPKEDILVVDDGSTDETVEICKKNNIEFISHQKNRGKGFALRTGFRWAIRSDYDAIITIDADLQHPPELIPKFIEELENGADLVVGNRMQDIKTMPIERRISNFLSSFFVSLLAGKKFLDSQCGFRAIRRWVIEKSHLYFDRYQMESELLIESARIGANIKFIPIPTIYNGNESHFNSILDTIRFILFVLFYYPTRIKKIFEKSCKN